MKHSSGTQNKVDSVVPNAAKLIRLTFHDCINEKDGAGCNGCLNFEGMSNIYGEDICGVGNRPDCSEINSGIRPARQLTTDNNNLLWAAKVLEAVYKDPAFGPSKLKALDVSLYDSGKSRADLWALAGLVAVQKTTELNNYFCNPTKTKPPPCFNQINKDSPSCFIDLPTPAFRSGRADCVPSCTDEDDYPFCTSKEEVHPNPHGNGAETFAFFEREFGFSNQEAAALMGAHTLGHPQEFNSMFRHYSWTGQRQKTQFNNQYYRFIVNATAYRMMSLRGIPAMEGFRAKDCDMKVSAYIGDEHGNPFSVRYRVRSEWRTESGGPWDWSLQGMGCSKVICASIKPEDYHMNSCCHYLDQCLTNKKFKCPTHNYVCEGAEGCTERDVFQGISMINPDMGLYLEFSTDADGRPSGCTGMDSQAWLDNDIRKGGRFSGEVDCPLNNSPTPDGGTVAKLMERYADDQDAWIKDFVNVYDKMLENGVDKQKLVAVPPGWYKAYCHDGRMTCIALP